MKYKINDRVKIIDSYADEELAGSNGTIVGFDTNFEGTPLYNILLDVDKFEALFYDYEFTKLKNNSWIEESL